MRHTTWTTGLLVLALAAGGCHGGSAGATPPPLPAVATATNGRVAVTVDAAGYHPATINAPAGQPLTVVFTRTSDEGCGQQVVFPEQHITRDLPLNRAVEVTVTPAAGTLAFTCGMNMYRGAVVAR